MSYQFSIMKGESVGAVWNFDDNVVGGTLVTVIVEQLKSKAACLYPDCRISLRIEVIGTAEDLGRNLIFLQRGAGLGKFVLG
ncbi:MAG: hypothetical protein DMG93_11075 [Acidobacteria bacterium]|nr:MAG: hypothetical protein DMG93_11075 [Acidobacteriota bacterium]